ncbi:hypothetical protein [Paracoccus xiamenensis]|uniref:hypothetical protein n=1 Tax=Paracoccus xiamenensis TaxID=2714901 RepID=UPI00140B3AD4|nr:hypothetical protein [Paracoccus xiamenensis]NHF71598.1 hypothetical protein [Paracoccus xiamenensis]
MNTLAEIYVLTGMGLGLGVTLIAALGVRMRHALIFAGLCVGMVLLIPVLARISPFSIGLPLTGACVMLGGFLVAFRLMWRAGLALRLFAGGAVAAYAGAGWLLPLLFPTDARSDVFVYQQGLILLALPMLLGAATGALRDVRPLG